VLTDSQIKKAKAAEKAYRLTDGGGLHLFVTPAGGKIWRQRYLFGGQEKLLTFGPYPQISLAEARQRRDDAKGDLREGRDPSAVKKLRKLAKPTATDTFESVAREWHTLQSPMWTPIHAGDVIHTLERDVFPDLGHLALDAISAPEVLRVLRKVEDRGSKETARRLRQRISSVFVYAIASGRASNDPGATVQRAMAPVKKGRQPAVTDLDEARQMLRNAERWPASPVTKLALRILALTAVRPGTLITTPWAEMDELDPDFPVWQIPAARMKLRLHLKDDEARDHLVPLSRQAVEAIDALRQMTGRGPLMFPNARRAHLPMSENAIGYLLNRAGYHQKHVPHGWRATFSTVMNERFKSDRQVIDLMLSHVPKDKVEGAYNRAAHLERRAELAQEWADLLMQDQAPAASLLTGPRKILKRQAKPPQE
jgi:integrase